MAGTLGGQSTNKRTRRQGRTACIRANERTWAGMLDGQTDKRGQGGGWCGGRADERMEADGVGWITQRVKLSN